jgi:hypothetical protein
MLPDSMGPGRGWDIVRPWPVRGGSAVSEDAPPLVAFGMEVASGEGRDQNAGPLRVGHCSKPAVLTVTVKPAGPLSPSKFTRASKETELQVHRNMLPTCQ